MVNLAKVWRYRGFIKGAVKRDYQKKYVNSALGWAWTILEPLAMILIYTIIFANVMKAKLPGVEGGWAYSIYLCAGIIFWDFFARTLNRVSGIFIEYGDLIKKQTLPKSILPIIATLSESITFWIMLGLFLVFLSIVGSVPELHIFISLLPVLIIQQLLAVGLGVFLGVLNVFFRDFGKALGVTLTFWFWLTPIVYPFSLIPESYQKIVLTFNPIAQIIKSYQDAFIYNLTPDYFSLLPNLLLAVVFCGAGYWLFRRLNNDMVDEL
jgi:lipopolysaccharide transport system permease protein